MQQQTAQDLATALRELKVAHDNLIDSPPEEIVARADDYQAAREAAHPVFGAAQNEYDLQKAGASTPGSPPSAPAAGADTPEIPIEGSGDAAQPPPPPTVDPTTEAAPGVPLVQPPGFVISAANIGQFGPIAVYKSGDVIVKATTFALATGCAINTGVPDAVDVATGAPSRVILNEDGTLTVWTQDEFAANYVPTDTPPAQGAAS